MATRIGGGAGGADSTLGGFAATGGSRGAGMAALAKVLAICAGTVGGAAACVATGVVPTPLLDPPDHGARPAAKVSRHPRHLAEEGAAQPTVDYEVEGETEAGPQPEERTTAPAEDEKAKPKKKQPAGEAGAEAAAEEAATSAPPPSESGAVEYTEPAPAPAATTATSSSSSSSASSSSTSSSSGSAAGEFGP